MSNKKDEDMREVEVAPKIDITNIHSVGSVIAGPVYFNVDDSIKETIETLVEDHQLPGDAENYNLHVTDGSGDRITLDRLCTVEYYSQQLTSYTRIELSTHEPPAQAQPDLEFDLKGDAGATGQS